MSHATPTASPSIFPSRYWADCSTGDFAAARASGRMAQTVAVLPVAATEQHGPHLPCNVDTAIADAIIASSLAHLHAETPVLFLPTQAVGFSPEHSAFPGTLTLKADTLIRLWTDIGESVAAAGVHKLILFNTHGGQGGLLDVVGRDLRMRLGMQVWCVNWWNLPLLDAEGRDVNDLFGPHEHRFGVHAGDVETSLMRAIDSSHVVMAQAQNFASQSQARAQQFVIAGNGKTAKLAWATQDYNPAGAMGNAAAATTAKGQALLDAAGRSFASLIAEIHAM